MAPSCIDCAPNDLFCAEDALGVVAWDDGETGSLYGEEDQHYNLDFCDQQFVSSIDEHLWDDSEVAAFVEKETLYVPNLVEKTSAEAKAWQDAVDWILKVCDFFSNNAAASMTFCSLASMDFCNLASITLLCKHDFPSVIWKYYNEMELDPTLVKILP